MIGPSIVPMPPITTMKMIGAVHCTTLNESFGCTRRFDT
jgi:hypothetical protein